MEPHHRNSTLHGAVRKPWRNCALCVLLGAILWEPGSTEIHFSLTVYLSRTVVLHHLSL